ncbi:hypothetical protein F5Y00DRAFT_197066 [Daldinia vernicosa]|uniref:uncharacterized protein n=1 Tax=Daldinia vernicosa TaxID=114800 RepID=UPI00200850AE|nr:uncharacterized protein F5Y00DRAFT_197066 [Daldinia vernicosa]KAI0844609.1 hypothetical protein F5Y00DRAFT_197066 [Daldinia vernicosa]
MHATTYLGFVAILAISRFADARPMKHYEGLAETYIQAFGSNMIANDTDSVAQPSSVTPTSTQTESACKPFKMPAVPPHCLMMGGELACHGQSLYCRYPTDWGVGYDPVGECWTC